MEKKEIIQKLNDSLEVSTIRLQLLVELGMVALAVGLHYLTNLTSWNHMMKDNVWLYYGIVIGITLIPITGIHLWQFWRIYHKCEFIRFYRVKLAQPHGSYFRSMYFTVVLQDEEGTIIARTHSIFAYAKSMVGPSMEEYLNQTVTVGYNEETGEVVVIG